MSENEIGSLGLKTEAPGDTLMLCSFRLAERWFGLDAADIFEIRVLEALTPVAGAPAWLKGLVNIRGEILTLLDLSPLLEPAGAPAQGPGFVVLLGHLDERLCLLVDEVGDEFELANAGLEALPISVGPLLTSLGRAFWSGFPGGLVLFDTEALFRPGLGQQL
ncbi:MAG: chemotaxis protein CheW [Candidatus Sericytochromatia bacterium]